MATDLEYYIDHNLDYTTNWDLYKQLKKRFANIHAPCIEYSQEYWDIRKIALKTYPEKDISVEEKVWKTLHNPNHFEFEKEYTLLEYKKYPSAGAGGNLDFDIERTLEAFYSLTKEQVYELEYDHTNGVLYTQTNTEETSNKRGRLVFEYEKEGHYIEIVFYDHFCQLYYLDDSKLDEYFEWPSFKYYVIELGEKLDIVHHDMKFINDSLKDICNPSICLIMGDSYYCSNVKDLIFKSTVKAVLDCKDCKYITKDIIGKNTLTESENDLPFVFLYEWQKHS